MELRQLTYAVAVADAGSFTAAARRCHVSQSALSTQVAQLENELGARLFTRTTRRVSLTESGVLFIPGARQLLADTANLRAQVSAHSTASRSTLRVGGTQTANRVLQLPAALGELHRRHPRVRITMTTGPSTELLDAIIGGTLDVGLASMVPGPLDSAVVFRALCPPEPLVAIVPAAAVRDGRTSVGLSELATVGPFIEFRTGTLLRAMVDATFRDAGLHREIMFELGQIADVARCAMNGLGAAIVPKSFTDDLCSAESVVLAIDGHHPTLSIGAYTRRTGPEPLIEAALELFATSAKRSDA
ncbi:hypothetical protein B1R94_08020 [Mycolicibacterium litorale]|nr:hypothetical protein B1R94_08020 [Mycolicibacterium litorale]